MKRADRWIQHCRCCGVEFRSVRETATWCSAKCRKRWSRFQTSKEGNYIQNRSFKDDYRIRPRRIH